MNYRRPALLAIPLLAFAAWSLASMQSGDALDRRPPNVLLVVWSGARADRIGCCGAETSATPWLDRFAEDALVFERAYTPAVGTLAAHASLFTGVPASTHGAGVSSEELDPRYDTLAERFAGAGYATYLFTAVPLVSERTGLDAGFERVDRSYEGPWSGAARRATAQKRVARDRSCERARSDDVASFKDAAPVASRAFLDWMESERGERPFFACLELAECRAPRTPSMEARCEAMQRSDLIELGLELDPDRPLESEDARLAALGVYDASLRELDRATGELVDALRHRGRLDDTLVVLTSDRGEALGEHAPGEWLNEELVHVPLVIRAPRRFGRGPVARPVSTLDVYATLVDAAGLAGPFEPPASIDLASNARPEEGPVFVELFRAPSDGPELGNDRRVPAIAVVEDQLKLVARERGSSELFDLEGDPRELHDLARQRREDVERFEGNLADWSDRYGGLRFAPEPERELASGLADELREAREELEASPAAGSDALGDAGADDPGPASASSAASWVPPEGEVSGSSAGDGWPAGDAGPR